MTPYEDIKFNWYNYNCAHFTREVWLELTGVDLGLRVPTTISRQSIVDAVAKGEADIVGTLIREIPAPEDPCLVLLSPGIRCVPHCGVFTAGALLHLPKNGIVTHEPLENAMQRGGFKSVRYFR